MLVGHGEGRDTWCPRYAAPLRAPRPRDCLSSAVNGAGRGPATRRRCSRRGPRTPSRARSTGRGEVARRQPGGDVVDPVGERAVDHKEVPGSGVEGRGHVAAVAGVHPVLEVCGGGVGREDVVVVAPREQHRDSPVCLIASRFWALSCANPRNSPAGVSTKSRGLQAMRTTRAKAPGAYWLKDSHSWRLAKNAM